MALQVAWTDPDTRVSAPTAYARIMTVFADVVSQTLVVQVGLYLDANSRQTGGIPFVPPLMFNPPFSVLFGGGSVNIQTVGYNFLKSLPAFSGAIDV